MEWRKESLLKSQAGRDGKVKGGRVEGRESGSQPVFIPLPSMLRCRCL